MPIYEYRCDSCGHQQEFLQKVSDAPLTVCTKCDKPTFSKMVTAAGFQLKGSGWYATDFRNSGAKPAAKSTEGSAAKSTEGSAAKSPEASASKGESAASSDSKSAESKPADKKASPPSSGAA